MAGVVPGELPPDVTAVAWECVAPLDYHVGMQPHLALAREEIALRVARALKVERGRLAEEYALLRRQLDQLRKERE